MLAIPITLITLYIGIYFGHWAKANKTHTDLLDIPKKYQEREKSGFWVAILLNGDDVPSLTAPAPSGKSNTIKPYAFVSEDKDATVNEIERSLFPSENSLVGTLAMDIKEGMFSRNIYSIICLLYTSPSPRDGLLSRMPSSA